MKNVQYMVEWWLSQRAEQPYKLSTKKCTADLERLERAYQGLVGFEQKQREELKDLDQAIAQCLQAGDVQSEELGILQYKRNKVSTRLAELDKLIQSPDYRETRTALEEKIQRNQEAIDNIESEAAALLATKRTRKVYN